MFVIKIVAHTKICIMMYEEKHKLYTNIPLFEEEMTKKKQKRKEKRGYMCFFEAGKQRRIVNCSFIFSPVERNLII